MEKNFKKKYNVGLNGQQCIGPCYPAGTRVLHPITLIDQSVKDRPFCPTMVWKDEKNNVDKWVDVCLVADDMESNTPDDIILDYTFPTIGFTCENFLRSYYGIFSFESAVDWLSNNKSPFYTHMRIINCAWKIYGANTDVINDQLIDFYSNVIKKEWIRYIYPHVAKYIYVDNKNIYIKENTDDINENKVEKINYFNKKFNTKQIIYKVLNSYIEDNKSIWDDIQDHNDNIKYYYIEYIINKIKNTIL